MPKAIEHLGQKVLYEAPAVFALLFAGPAAYMSQGDPQVREKLSNTKQQVRHWSTLYAWGTRNMTKIIALGTISALASYHQSKEKMWLAGGALLFSIVPYTLLFMKKTNSTLNGILKDSGQAEELGEPEKASAKSLMKKWINLHRGRALLALGSAVVFFVAKQYTKSA